MTNYINDGFIIKNGDTEEVIQIPYNIINILVTEDNILNILNKFEVNIDKINHMNYFIQAFTHKSYCKKDIYPQEILEASKKEINNKNLIELQDKSYERLEYFGDRVLKVIVSMYLFHRYPNQEEGFMTRLQTKIEDKKNLYNMSKEMGLDKYFLISKQIENINGRNLEKIHEDVFEAFIGALFLSNGFESCMYLIVNLLETLIDYSDKLYCDNNYKDQLLRIYHQKKWKYPQYIIIHQEGLPHKRKYIMGVEKQDYDINCDINEKCISYGAGYSKKEGEQRAAKMALIILDVLKEDQYTQEDIYYPDWANILNINIKNKFINYKNQLLDLYKEKKWSTPKYIIFNENQKVNNEYLIGIEKQNYDKKEKLENRCISYGLSNNKEDAEQKAAKMALIILNQFTIEYNTDDIYYPNFNSEIHNSQSYKLMSEKQSFIKPLDILSTESNYSEKSN